MLPRRQASIVFVSAGLALLTALPYVVASLIGRANLRFSGFLFNPLDGMTYLAKMRQGWDGSWLYRLAFTPNPGPGALLFTYYLLLGHVARVFSLTLTLTFHAARILAGFALLITMWAFASRLRPDSRGRWLTWLMLALGSGFGWAVAVLGGFTADLWVAEFVPFLSLLTSAHFPLALALLLLITIRMGLPPQPLTWRRGITFFVCGTLLSILQPFALLPLGTALVLWLLLERKLQQTWLPGVGPGLLVLGLSAAPWLAYDAWVIRAQPVLALWAAQNLTPTPPLWDVLLSAGLPGALAVIAILKLVRQRGAPDRRAAADQTSRLFALWAVLNLLLLYAPVPLQRRLMMGWFFPLVALAAPLLDAWIWAGKSVGIRLALALALLLPSNVIVIAAAMSGAAARDPAIYLTQDEAAALDYLDRSAQPGAIVLASPETGTFIPGFTGLQVLYGHPMETAHAPEARREVAGFFASHDAAAQAELLTRAHVDYLFYGPRERAYGGQLLVALRPAFQRGAVTLYATAAGNP